MEAFRHFVLLELGVAEIGDVSCFDVVELSRVLTLLCEGKHSYECIGLDAYVHHAASNFILQVDYRFIV